MGHMSQNNWIDRRAFLKNTGMTAVLGAVGAGSASATERIGVQYVPVKQVPDFDILIENGRIARIGPNLTPSPTDQAPPDRVIDATRRLVIKQAFSI